ncbi:chemotaxis protein CheB [Cupriavidus cauae]|uniref:protein-glutamate methylesterase n=1 Tax=Cupriavidus cauae TaxID=2608999 RepID=A0A5M8BAZ3_9BURK|nr:MULTISPECIES: chemotaxis protein CheB [Cupriavidus]KAA0181858.1 chemotaxis protein CheB [Cupriavidus gilardii]KAA6133137.1 chemotaxis protein CheB [Cupriavidus cauae]MCA7084657.1 chemotaxis protein CheB [Cupriavidus sp. DB3]UZN49574.1 chemotaxis protein CheB [Cupriavidus cauae]
MNASIANPSPAPDAVVIGGSAGGIEALNVLLPMLPAAFRPALIVVLHLRPDTPSLLPQLFSLRCALPVCEAEDKMPVRHGHLYLAPPDYHLLVERDSRHGGAYSGSHVGTPVGNLGSERAEGVHFALSVDPPERFSRPSIDVLFESAAHAWREALLGILLSGANDDGARGLETIRHCGGRTWVQAPDTASAETMPAEAIARGAVDEVLTLEAIGSRLRRAVH